MDLRIKFPILSDILQFNEKHGIEIVAKNFILKRNCSNKLKYLKYYYSDEETQKIIENNIEWAKGKSKKPVFKFAYLMLPTLCNQACVGCFMGQDLSKLPKYFAGAYFNKNELDEIISFLLAHGAKSIVYGGMGELFLWKNAIDYIKYINKKGLKFIVFTNGTLISKKQIELLNKLESTIIISLRDTIESNHNKIVKRKNFIKSLSTIEYALSLRMNLSDRLAVEIPVTNENEHRVLNNFLPAMRFLEIAPMIEEYICDNKDQSHYSPHNFDKARSFFIEASKKDSLLGFNWKPEFGTRIIAQPQCKRSLYSFTIFPNRDVADCPVKSRIFGNIQKESLKRILYSQEYKKTILNFNLCACSVFYTHNKKSLTHNIPNYLRQMI
jgi:MoaA/NifB/PqqE/SkfB family radical SAM enzyme